MNVFSLSINIFIHILVYTTQFVITARTETSIRAVVRLNSGVIARAGCWWRRMGDGGKSEAASPPRTWCMAGVVMWWGTRPTPGWHHTHTTTWAATPQVVASRGYPNHTYTIHQTTRIVAPRFFTYCILRARLRAVCLLVCVSVRWKFKDLDRW